MCNCTPDVKVNNYKNQIRLVAPPHIIEWASKTVFGSRETICIDTCLVEEIKELWSLGIVTTGCCCGHNELDGYIGVIDADITKMKSLGYVVQFNPCRPNDQDTFFPKSVEIISAG